MPLDLAYIKNLLRMALSIVRSSLHCRMFVGQSKGAKKGGSGITQKEQQKVLADFRAGEFNTLVATCIGEEGLDICQVRLYSLDS